ncbi:hypothetical protein [Aetokthonos hydrillicola]|uniref:hypothetical protein n=1 Tax=Aetokthonos hydrillicola TaxID=1550245 RepID=UPI001ABA8DEC
MVTPAFSQYDYLLAEHPDQLEEIVDARLEVLALEHPDKASYYKGLRSELSAKINSAWDNDQDFGWVQCCRTTKAFVKERNLMGLFDDVPALSSEIDQEMDETNHPDDPDFDEDEIRINFTGDDLNLDQWLNL